MSYLLCRIFLLAPDAAPAAERQRWGRSKPLIVPRLAVPGFRVSSHLLLLSCAPPQVLQARAGQTRCHQAEA
ncbi:hypothetical protein BDV09DRAFT_181662 [Aspergillus tetrazonus]